MKMFNLNKKFLVIIITFLAISFCGLINLNQQNAYAADSDIVNIPDENFKKILNKKLGVSDTSADITEGQLKNIEYLSIEDAYIVNITGIEYCINLYKVKFDDCDNLSDISSIGKLTKLQFLYIYNSKNISDYSSLANLTTLKILELYNNNITDISSLENLTNLQSLNLYNNNITDISILKNLTNLQQLSLNSNNITDISSLKDLTNLQRLNLYNNNITDINNLKDLTNLEYLYLSSNNITDISSLKNLTNLEDLGLNSNNITDISSLKNLINLKYLSLSSNNITDINSLENLTNLESLVLQSNNIAEINVLTNLTKLETLKLEANNITDISSLNSLTNLLWLDLFSNNITDISSLNSLTNLQFLRLEANNITNINSLKDLTNLESLWLSSNNIADISSLKNLTNLEILSLNSNNITDISILKNLTNLKSLFLSHNNITDEYTSIFSCITKLEDLDINNNKINDLSFVSDLPNSAITYSKLTMNTDEEIYLITTASKLIINNKVKDVNGNYIIPKYIYLSGNKIEIGASSLYTYDTVTNDIIIDISLLNNCSSFRLYYSAENELNEENYTIDHYKTINIIYCDPIEAELTCKKSVNGSDFSVISGDTVTFGASATGGSESYTYKFERYNTTNGQWYVLQDYSSSSSVTYTFKYVGTFDVRVTVMDSAGHTASSELIRMTVLPELNVSLQSNGSSDDFSVISGAIVTFDAVATGGSESYTYKFERYNTNNGQWYVLQDYSSASSLTYTFKYVGMFDVKVTVIDSAGNTASSELIRMTVLPELNVSLQSNGSSDDFSVISGATVMFNASATGGSGNYTYKFDRYNINNGNWYILQDYSSSSSVTYTFKYLGTFDVRVTVMDSLGSTVSSELITMSVEPKTGWQYENNNWYYYNSEGNKVIGWNKINTKWYYFDSSGKMQSSKWISNKYYVKSNGAMAVSEFVDNGRYYVDENGAWVNSTKWLKVNNNWYYIYNGTVQVSRWMKISNKWYYFDANGIMQAAKWLKISGYWYYFDANGVMQAAKWVKISGYWYYFDANGIMQASKWINGKYYVKADGRMAVSEWVDNNKYYVDENGIWVSNP